jgi:hypothetical protein
MFVKGGYINNVNENISLKKKEGGIMIYYS